MRKVKKTNPKRIILIMIVGLILLLAVKFHEDRFLTEVRHYRPSIWKARE